MTKTAIKGNDSGAKQELLVKIASTEKYIKGASFALEQLRTTVCDAKFTNSTVCFVWNGKDANGNVNPPKEVSFEEAVTSGKNLAEAIAKAETTLKRLEATLDKVDGYESMAEYYENTLGF